MLTISVLKWVSPSKIKGTSNFQLSDFYILEVSLRTNNRRIYLSWIIIYVFAAHAAKYINNCVLPNYLFDSTNARNMGIRAE